MSDPLIIQYDLNGFEQALTELISRLEQRAPLMRALAADMGDAVEENFNQQGRPAWMGWSPRYAKKRAGGKILQKSGRLASSIEQDSDNDSATVGTNVVYARIHQEGGTIHMPPRSQRAYHRQGKDGRVGNRFVKKSRANFMQWNTLPAYSITIPARPYLQLNQDDLRQMEDTAERYFRQLID
ncbi:phage virion morphogenesis protein [Shigella sonnei]|nr:phage virion morphogenesis protein [Escherichia coli]EFW5532214.1 phage virion morphogenesis protein [Shigella sonnei]EFX7053222.1 phage virion morphogenesis protein [Shigella sonnei]EFZ0655776.1 phage virion morphogenesis protein [Shigella sonnei]EFZ2872819.1 phage virion morphogenesis protein [Shigella sonnei]